MSWSAERYVAFEKERTRPVRDLLGAVPAGPARAVVDLGCGPGNSTELLAARYPQCDVLGIDSSADMVDAARERLPGVRVELVDIHTWIETGPRVDVILANAVLQWLPDHPGLLGALAARLEPGGRLAVQMPDNLNEPSHRLMRELAADGPWREQLQDAAAARTVVASAPQYHRWLRESCAAAEVWRTTYWHHLQGGEQAIVEWFKGSGLRPFLAPLDEADRAEFLARFAAGIARAYPPLPDGSVLLPFPRLFMVAVR